MILFPVICFATVWYVHPDSSLNSIQTALNLCTDNDTVLVGPGTYTEYIVWPQTQGIDLVSELGADSTVIDAYDFNQAVIYIDSTIDNTTIISGLTITNGYQFGIFLLCASPVIMNNIISNNEHWSTGGAEAAGVFCYYSNPSIQYNDIRHNGAAGEIGTCGGIYCHASSPMIVCNTIADNYSIGGITGSGSGAGIYCESTSSPYIFGNTITYNSVEDGGGILVGNGCDVIIRNNIIAINYSQDRGGGILCLGTSLIDSNTISDNHGCGIDCATNGNVIINYNNIVQNRDYAVYNQNSYFINAEYNWWGDSTGPYHPDSNPGGLGDTVSDYVDFIPWLYWPGVEDRPSYNIVNNHNAINASILTGSIPLPADKPYNIFDITGRQIHTLNPVPGIYFIEVDGEIRQKVIKVK